MRSGNPLDPPPTIVVGTGARFLNVNDDYFDPNARARPPDAVWVTEAIRMS